MNSLLRSEPYLKTIVIALLIAGGAISLNSCDRTKSQDETDMETLITQQSDTLLLVNSENGIKTYRFTTPLMEYYEFAREPYREFRRGIDIETYKDSTGAVESTLVADYAIFWEKRSLWEAKGNVVAVNAKGQILETQQLFWNQRTKKIYSNVDTKVTQGTDVIIGVGFESDESMEDFIFRRPRGKISVDVEPTTASDSVAMPPDAVPVADPGQIDQPLTMDGASPSAGRKPLTDSPMANPNVVRSPHPPMRTE